jgi:YebC/PmpR family DNA-binding regulatory protein
MAGHSHSANIQFRKDRVDKKRAVAFAKLSRSITVAARQGGGSLDGNAKLRLAVEKARVLSMSKDNIDRAIKKGTGEGVLGDYEEIVYEGYGPGGVAVMLDILTDNRHRTAADVRGLFDKFGGNLAATGAVGWMFERRGRFVVAAGEAAPNDERLLEIALEVGADDVVADGEVRVVLCNVPGFAAVQQGLVRFGVPLRAAELALVPTQRVAVADLGVAQRVAKTARCAGGPRRRAGRGQQRGILCGSGGTTGGVTMSKDGVTKDGLVVGRWHWLGTRAAVRDALAAAFGSAPVSGGAGAVAAGDLVVVDSLAGGDACVGWPGGHAFAAVRGLKDQKGVQVFVVVESGDRIGGQLARFCLADGVLGHRAGARLDLAELEAAASRTAAKRPALDALLARLEAAAAQSERGASAVARLLQLQREDSLVTRLQDPETGLYDGAYATLKLDEEWKRSRRFHQPLGLLLLDLGAGVGKLPAAEQQPLLAAAAGVFLNECRDIDVLARFAPTTFLFLLPGTGADGAVVLAKRMLAALGERLPKRPEVRCRAGLAVAPSSQIPDQKAFLMVAEACLRAAETSGGDGGLGTSWQ